MPKRNEQLQTNQLHTADAPLHSTEGGHSPRRGPSTAPRAGVLTHGEQVAIDLQHHSPVQASLGGVQMLPLLPAKVYGHVLK